MNRNTCTKFNSFPRCEEIEPSPPFPIPPLPLPRCPLHSPVSVCQARYRSVRLLAILGEDDVRLIINRTTRHDIKKSRRTGAPHSCINGFRFSRLFLHNRVCDDYEQFTRSSSTEFQFCLLSHHLIFLQCLYQYH